ncbi:MAG TPA: protein kinase [Bryobacteraceae bacterium]|jgi:serine/threonine protein kinase
MTRNWNEWEGRAVGGFPLLKFLGSSEASAVFRTERGGKPASIKLLPLTGEAAGAQLARWEKASTLSHPHLTPVYEHATAKTEDGALIFVITEFADEVLSQVDRPLTSSEALDMLAPALNALAYLHGKGFAHGRLKPANILAIDDRLKLSGESPLKIGERHAHSAMPQSYDAPEIEQKGVGPAADVWSLGMTLVEVLTQSRPTWDASGPRLPEAVPEQFREIARQCLRQDPAQRASVSELSEWLQAGAKALPAPRSMRRFLIPGIATGAVIAVGVIAIPYFDSSGSKTPVAPATATQTTAPAPPPAAAVPSLDSVPVAPPAEPKPPIEKPAPKESAKATEPPPVEPAPARVSHQASSQNQASNQPLPAGVVQQVIPDVPSKSRTTVHGKVPIMVRVQTDASGSVTSAVVEAGKLSTYFADMSLKAARQWKFAPGEPHEWMLRFEYTRNTEHPVTVEATQR